MIERRITIKYTVARLCSFLLFKGLENSDIIGYGLFLFDSFWFSMPPFSPRVLKGEVQNANGFSRELVLAFLICALFLEFSITSYMHSRRSLSNL